MTLRDSTGNVLNKTEFEALLDENPAPETTYTVNDDVYESYSLSGEGDYEMGKRRKFHAGSQITQSQLDALYPAATVPGALVPATGPAVGNTVVTINGTDLGGTEGVDFGATAATEVKVVSNTKVTCKAPAHAAGAVNVTVKDDSGNVIKTAAYTYT